MEAEEHLVRRSQGLRRLLASNPAAAARIRSHAPRQQQQTINMMLSGATTGGLDPEGSLVDADVGAHYTWLNPRHLSGSGTFRFVVWF